MNRFWLFCLIVPASCHRAEEARQITPVERAEPRIKLERVLVEMGSSVQDEDVVQSIVVRNEGKGRLEIGLIERSRFCAGRAVPTLLDPGAAGRLDVTCNSDLYGPMHETLTVHSNDPRSPKLGLHLAAHVSAHLAFDTNLIDLSMPFGEERSQDVHLVGAELRRAHVKRKDSPVADVEILSLPSGTNKGPSFRVRCLGRKVGANVGNLIVSTGLERVPQVALPYSCKVKGTLEVSPTNPVINLKVSGEKAATITVRSSQPNFEVHEAHVTDGPFGASFHRAPDGLSFLVKVSAHHEQMDSETRGVGGKLVIISNDRTEPRKEIPVLGFGHVNQANPLN